MGTRNIKPTKNMKTAAWIFGKASALSKGIMSSLSAQLPADYNQGRRNKLSGSVHKALVRQWDEKTGKFKFLKTGFKTLNGFEWDSEYDVSDLLLEMPEVSSSKGKLEITFQQLVMGQHLNFPLKSFRCDLITGMSLFDLENGTMVALSENQTIVFKNDKGVVEPFKISYGVPPRCLCVITLFLEYFQAGKAGWKLLNQRDFTPGCILAAIYTSGTTTKSENRTWIDSNANLSTTT